MEHLPDGQAVCPRCGHNNSHNNNGEWDLHEGTILKGLYLVGRVLGQDGLGNTYLGIELNKQRRVAIKEYYPANICSRQINNQQVKVQEQSAETFRKGMDLFMREAKVLSSFTNSPSIVHVRDLFQENNTVYTVMEYVDGVDLTEEIRRCAGHIPCKRLMDLTMPLLHELYRVHSENLLHRDIKPDNLKIVQDGSGDERLVLLNFGTARFLTNTLIQTPGYAPIEQYSTRTPSGPYTDVYSLCATMYTALTGEKPPSAPDREIEEDELKPFSSFGLDIPENVEKTIIRGMSIHYKDRPQDMKELYKEFRGESRGKNNETPAVNESPVGENEPPAKGSGEDPEDDYKPNVIYERNENEEIPPQSSGTGKKKFPKWIIVLLAILLLAAAGYFAYDRFLKGTDKDIFKNLFPAGATETAGPADETPAPLSTAAPTDAASAVPTEVPTEAPTEAPTEVPVEIKPEILTESPTEMPLPTATPEPTETPVVSEPKMILNVGDIFSYGKYEIDGTAGTDPIEWQVLAVENGHALVISRYGLESKAYHNTLTPVTWETSDLRAWLNGEFYDNAFEPEEKSQIFEVILSNPDNDQKGTDGGSNTQDRIFLLSVDEARQYFNDDRLRICQASETAKRNGAYVAGATGNSWWWLRTPGNDPTLVAGVSVYGEIRDFGSSVDKQNRIVRPAFWINIAN